jgi:tryptophanyl-tRNA synthetase
MDLQDPTSKMSKSSPTGCVNLLDPLKTTEKKFKSAVTDSETQIRFDQTKKPGVSNLLTINSAYSGQSVEQLVKAFEGRMYGDLKKETAEVVLSFIEPYQNRVAELLTDKSELETLMHNGADRAIEIAQETIDAVYAKIGFAL